MVTIGNKMFLAKNKYAVTIARFLEFGTSKMGAKPFMTPAFESEKQHALEKIIEVLKEKLGL